MQRLIFHVDVNSAFLSWEAARRVADGEPDLRLIPSAIGGDRDKRTGVILAKSIPAKKFGVTTGEPVAMALRKCPQLVLAKPDFALYTRNSKAFIAICRRFAPVVEQVSIDECFLDMTGTGLLYPDPIAIAHTIKDTIFSELGFTVNVGIAPNKLLAKMASDFKKPNKVHTLFASEIPQKQAALFLPQGQHRRRQQKQAEGTAQQGHVQGRGGPGPGGGCGQRPGDGAPQNGLVQQAVLPVPDQAHGGGGQKIQQVDPLSRRLIHPEYQGHHQQQKGPAAYAPGRQHPAAHPGQQGQYKLLHSRYRTPP